MEDFKEERKLWKNLLRNAKSTFEKCFAHKIVKNPKAFDSHARIKLEIKETVGPMADGDVVVYDDVPIKEDMIFVHKS